MKKSLLALLIASALPMAAAAEVVVYGKGNVSLQHADEEASGDKIELVSNASRIGLKGGEQISDGLKAIYQFEYQTEVDDGSGSSGTFGQRNIYIGLQGSAGTIMGGYFDTPTKVAQEKIDLFNDLEGDITHIFKGEIRASNIVQYVSPVFGGGLTGTVAYITKENEDVDNGVSASLGYAGETFYVGLAADQDVEAEDVDLLRAVGRVTLGSVQLGALVESYDNGVIDEEGALVSALWNLNSSWALKAQYGQSEVRMADGESASLGADYKATKNITLYSYLTHVENDTEVMVDAPRDDNYFGLGMDMKF